MYAAIIVFLKEGQRPGEIRANTVRYHDYFGKDGFLLSDSCRLVEWTEAILNFSKKLDLLPENSMLKDWHLFEEFIEVCLMIVKRFGVKKI